MSKLITPASDIAHTIFCQPEFHSQHHNQTDICVFLLATSHPNVSKDFVNPLYHIHWLIFSDSILCVITMCRRCILCMCICVVIIQLFQLPYVNKRIVKLTEYADSNAIVLIYNASDDETRLLDYVEDNTVVARPPNTTLY